MFERGTGSGRPPSSEACSTTSALTSTRKEAAKRSRSTHQRIAQIAWSQLSATIPSMIQNSRCKARALASPFSDLGSKNFTTAVQSVV